MKKGSFCLIFVLFISIILSPSISFAANDLKIDRWIVDALLLENGNLEISEDITFNFDSSFKGVYRNIILEKIDSIENLSIYEMISGQEVPYKEVDRAKRGDRDKFTRKNDKKGIKIQIFTPSNNEKKTFRLKYLLKDIAIKHSNTAELYYKFLGRDNKTYIDYFSINFHLPRFERDRINIFSHGTNQGKIYFSDEIIKSEIHNVSSGEFIANRILFPNDYILLSENIGSDDFNSIMKEERLFAEKLELDRKKKAERKSLFSKFSIYLSSFTAIIIFCMIIKERFKKIETNR